jgi:hypothetical protein
MRGNQVVIAGYYYDATYSMTIAKTALALLDGSTDAVTVVHETRCGAFSTVAAAPNGDLYFGSDTYAAAINCVAGNSSAPPGCLLRIAAGDNAFDPNYFVQVEALVEARPRQPDRARRQVSVSARCRRGELFARGRPRLLWQRNAGVHY